MKNCISIEVNKRTQTFDLSLALLLSLCLLAFATPLRGQSISPEPRRTPLLNGLNVLYYQQPSSPNVLLKLRIQSGASFDLAGKEGTIALLGDALFPDETTREYFTDELGGRLEVETTYDSLTVTLEGKASEYERIVESLRNALLNTPLSAEVVARLRERRAKAAQERDATFSGAADRAALHRLFGAYPYGRSVTGTAESLARIERADLMLARERFLNSDNATLVVSGNVEYNRAMRVLRQLLGAWRKGDRTFPPTFRQPEKVDKRTLFIDLTASGSSAYEVRLAARGVARTEADRTAARLLAFIARARWLKASGATNEDSINVHHDGFALGGVFMMSATVNEAATAARALQTAREILRTLATAPVSATELAQAKASATAGLASDPNTADALALFWLDREMYKITSVDESRLINNLSISDVQRVASKLFLNGEFAVVAAGDIKQLRTLMPFEAYLESNHASPSSSPPPPPRRP
ncbi:MAG: insulinase family protein [Pyrinomonadaceae bacterium]|nr:insulinase family protein [Pyrinomonadaceae bacterium]